MAFVEPNPFTPLAVARLVESRRPVREFIDEGIDLTVIALS